MYNDLFEIFGITIHSYGLMIGIGILCAYYLAEYRAKKRHIDSEVLVNLMFQILIYGFVSAKLLYYLTTIDQIIADPSILLDIGNGFVVYGGIIGGIVGGYLFAKKHQLDFLEYTDLILPSVALAQGFGRIGCFLAGCCYGAETSSPLSVVFPQGSLAPSGVHLIPTQLYSSAFDFLLCIALISIAKKVHQKGYITSFYMIAYSVGRFLIEFFRSDYRGAIGFLSTSQFISIFILIVGMILLFYQRKQTQ